MLLAIELAQRDGQVSFDLTLPGIVAVIVGILILVFPRFLNYLVAGYLIVVGLIQIFDIKV